MPGYGGNEKFAKVLSSEAHCFLIDIRNKDRLGFQLMPENISESKAAIYNEIPIVGRSLPLLGYAGSTSRSIALGLSFVALNRPGAGPYDTAFVRKQVRWLEAKVYPIYNGGFTFPPPLLWLEIGQALAMQCVMTAVTTSWFGPWDHVNEGAEGAAKGASSFRATVDCQFQEYGINDGDSKHPHGHEEAKTGANQQLGREAYPGGAQYIEIPLSDPYAKGQ